MIRFHISKLAVTLEWKSLKIDHAANARHRMCREKAHETILDRQCGVPSYFDEMVRNN
ncbi:hypothetical protein NIE88_11360 [Sporolactobacillus shoreicorticis]|uniref:Uncharacterized protein n=1 Tax=Sporolactobacillus shoreicorticis TaxID=1923877 RepID=A0ABW5S438_9BACL|nr:hypothetical protein [Sporolactobacillus shoreicorticis]MCO7126368.1 hypothetical protein [Sporolactobacillus shoreicorticis]